MCFQSQKLGKLSQVILDRVCLTITKIWISHHIIFYYLHDLLKFNYAYEDFLLWTTHFMRCRAKNGNMSSMDNLSMLPILLTS